jgi:hypothetical protein
VTAAGVKQDLPVSQLKADAIPSLCCLQVLLLQHKTASLAWWRQVRFADTF